MVIILRLVYWVVKLYLILSLGMVKQSLAQEEQVSLNVSQIPIRYLLYRMASLAKLDLILGEQVTGEVTLKLSGVTPLQVINLVSKSNALLCSKQDKLLYVLAEKDKGFVALSSSLLSFRVFKINFTEAERIYAILSSAGFSMLAKQCAIFSDKASNSIIVVGPQVKLRLIEKLLSNLDKLSGQIAIEARLVAFDADLTNSFGVKFADKIKLAKVRATEVAEGAVIDKPQDLNSLSLGFILSSNALDLELSALAAEGKCKIMASPKLVVNDMEQAYIDSGEEIPYTDRVTKNITSTKFKKAVLSLQVTPRLVGENKILLDLTVSQDSRGASLNNQPCINTHKIHTKVLINDGHTLVLGGIYKTEKLKIKRGISWLAKFPLLRDIFSYTEYVHRRKELVIFVTPQIYHHT